MSHTADQSDRSDLQPLLTISGHRDTISKMVYLPGGQRLVTGSYDKSVRIWDANHMQEGTIINHRNAVFGLAVTSDGRRIISGDDDGRITVWDVKSHKLIKEWTHTEQYPQVAISSNDRFVAFGSRIVVVHEMNSGRLKHKIELGGEATSLSFSPQGYKLACGMNGNIHIYDAESGRLVLDLHGHESWVYSLLWTRDGSKLYSASHDQTIRSYILALSLSPDGTKLASGSYDGAVHFWDATSCRPIGRPLRHEAIVCAVSFSPSGEFVAYAGDDNKVTLWRVPWWGDTATRVTILFGSQNPQLSSSPQSIKSNPPETASRTSDVPAIASTSTHPYASKPSRQSPTPIRHRSSSIPTPTRQIIPASGESASPSSQKDKTESPSSMAPDLTSYIVKLGERYHEGGSFGDVYKCHYISPSGVKEVAVKALRFTFTYEEGGAIYVKMLRRELGIWKRLDHGNIVPFLGTATGFGMQDAISLVSLWMPNGSLQKFLTNHDDELSIVHRLQLLSDVANGLDYLHSFPDTPITHGDLNCNNVLLDEYFTARLTDFGYSSFVGGIPDALAYLQRSTSRPGALRWTAPEQVEETYQRTPKSDIYSFGCIALQVLSGKQPWSEVREDAAVVLRLARGQKPSRPDSRPIDDRHWAFIQRCWSSVDARPSSEAVVSSIQRFLSMHQRSWSLNEVLASSSKQIPIGSSSGA